MAKIVSIEEKRFTHGATDYSRGGYEGLVVELDDGTSVKVGISEYQQCCESYGHVTSEDDFSDFIGAELHDVTGVDKKLESVVLPYQSCTDIMFVNFTTSKGVLQFVAYNDHNGYYGHDAVLIVGGVVKIEETL